MWQLLSDIYPYPGAPDITPFAAFFEYAEQQHVGAGLRTPPPLVAATIHSVVRPEWARYDMNPIHAAAFDGRSDLVLPLLDIGDAGVVDPSDEVQRRWRVLTDRLVHPVHAAALGGRVALVRRLLAVPGVTQELEDDGGRTVFHFAAASRYASAADLVGLTEGNSGFTAWAHRDSSGRTPLHEAANTGTLNMVHRLVSLSESAYCGSLEMEDARTKFWELPIHYAARSGNIAKFEAILTAMNVTKDELREAKTFHDAGVVHYALRSDSLDMVKHCMKYYNDNWDLVQETGSHGGGLLKCAGRSANPAVFAYAKQHVGHRPARSDDDGWTPLHSACAAGRRRMLRYLIEVEHYSPYAIDKDGYTVLHAAISSDSPFFFDEVAQLVNDDIRSRHFTSRESLGSLAIGKSNIAMLKHLVASGYCDLSVSPSKSRTTTYLMEAAQYSSLGVMEWLLQQGHRPWDVRDREGSSVRDIAMRRYDPVFVAGISALREKYPSTEGSTTSVHTEPER